MSAPRPRWTRRKEARPAELLAAALELFVERGYAATRLEDVAKRAGVSKGTVYLYFPGKEDLFKAVVREGLVPLLERGERMLAEHKGTAVDLIRDLVRGWWEGFGLTRYAGIPKLMVSECRNFPELGKFYVDEVIARGQKLVRAAVRRGLDSGEFRRIDPDHVARLVFAPLVLMVIYRHSFDFCSAQGLDPDAYVEQHLDILQRGLLATSRGGVRPARSAARV
jgi:AcrR family transcriptional regulator